jgi:hypothetical protein
MAAAMTPTSARQANRTRRGMILPFKSVVTPQPAAETGRAVKRDANG